MTRCGIEVKGFCGPEPASGRYYEGEGMKVIRTFTLLAPLAIAGCFLFSSGPESEMGRTPEELRNVREQVPPVYDVFPYGPVERAAVGRWARYRILEGEKSHEIMLGISGRTEEGTWVEVVDEESVSARFVSREGVVLKALYRSLDPSSRAIAQEIVQGREWPEEKVLSGERTESRGSVEIGESSLPVLQVEIEKEDFDGRITTESWAWSIEVPAVYAGGESGGLVSRRTRRGAISLVAFGTDYSPRIEK